MSHTLGVRQAQKQQSRRALLDAGLRLLERQNLSGLGLRELTREAGLSPAGFYRHFRDLPDLGVALVEESLGTLHAAIQRAFSEFDDQEALIERAVSVIADHVREHRSHFRFIARERYGGVQPVREAIAVELGRFTDEVAQALAAQPTSEGWSSADVRMLAALCVDHMVTTSAALLDAKDAEAERRIVQTARCQLTLIGIGRRHWLTGA